MGAVRQLLRTDFNQDFARIDTGIRAAKAQAGSWNGRGRISTGAYTGDNAASRTIHLGFRPRAVLVEMALGNRYGSNGGESISGGPAVDGWPVFYQDINGPCTPAIRSRPAASPLQDSQNRSMNCGTKYHYFAVK